MSQARATELAERSAYRRAVESVIWGMPAVACELLRSATVPDGGTRLITWSGPADWRNQTLTPNPDLLCATAVIDLSQGPVVLEVPPAAGGVLLGSVCTAWQVPLADIGPAGVDRGEGGRYVVLPPGHTGDAPPGHIVLRSNTWRVYALLRSVLTDRSERSVAQAAASLRRVGLRQLSEDRETSEVPSVDLTGTLVDATIPYDLRFFQALDRVVQAEEWLERDRPFAEMLASIGIVKGERFAPTERLAALLPDAAAEARALLAEEHDRAEPFYDSSRWTLSAAPPFVGAPRDEPSGRDGYPYTSRGVVHHVAFVGAKRHGLGQTHLATARDAAGAALESTATYRLRVPANVPVSQHWSVAMYDAETHAFIRGNDTLSVASHTPGLVVNPDGSVDVFFGPRRSERPEPNWIETGDSHAFELVFRFYGSQRAVLDKTWRLPDVQRVAM